MSIVSCPRCGDKVSVPAAASPSALVECPLCCEQYYLSDALIQLPPMLKVVGAAAAATSESEYTLAEPATAGIQPGVFDTSGGEAATIAPRPQLRTVSRPRPPEKSAVGEIIKVVLGGVAGLAVGLLVLWWGFGVDVGVGPKLSQVEYLRWMVPQRFWDTSIQTGSQGAALDTVEPLPKNARQSGKKPAASKPASDANDDPFGSGYFGSTGDVPDTAEAAMEPKPAGDPLLTVDPLEIQETTEVKPATNLEDELKIGDPLADLPAAPRTRENPQAGEKEKEPASEPTAEENPAPEKPPAEKPAEKPAPSEPIEVTGESPAPPEPEEPAASEKGDEPQPPKAEEPAPEPPSPEVPAEEPE